MTNNMMNNTSNNNASNNAIPNGASSDQQNASRQDRENTVLWVVFFILVVFGVLIYAFYEHSHSPSAANGTAVTSPMPATTTNYAAPANPPPSINTGSAPNTIIPPETPNNTNSNGTSTSPQ